MRNVSLVLLLGFLCLGSFCAIPVIIDTDIGTTMDDTWALGLLLASPEVDIKLIVTASQNTTQRAQIVAKFLTEVNRTDIPIGLGYSSDEYIGSQYNYAKDFSLSSYAGEVYMDGVSAFENTIQQYPGITVLELAPPINFASVIDMNPDLVIERVRVVAMGGSIYKGYFGYSGPSAEYNVATNITASQTMYSTVYDRVELLAAPLDTSLYTVIAGENYQSLVQVQNTNKLVGSILENYYYSSNSTNHSVTNILFDVQAAWMTFSTQYLEIEEFPIIVNSEGYTVVDYEMGNPTLFSISWQSNGIKNFATEVTNRLLNWN